MITDNKNIKALEDEALESVSGGQTGNSTTNHPYKVIAGGGAVVYSETKTSSSTYGTYPFDTVIFVSGSPFIGSDNAEWVKVPAQKGVSAGYVRSEDVALQNFSASGYNT